MSMSGVVITCSKCCAGYCVVLQELVAKRSSSIMSSFFFNDTATTEIYTLSLHDALPI